MDFTDWIRRAASDSQNSLIYFNALNEMRLAAKTSTSHLLRAPPSIYSEFARFLSSVGPLRFFEAPDAFADANNGPTSSNPAFAGLPILRRREFAGMKAMGSFVHKAEWVRQFGQLGISSRQCSDALTRVDKIIRRAIGVGAPPRDLSNDEKQKISDIINKGIVPTVLATSPRPRAATPTHAAKKKTVGLSKKSAKPSSDHTPFWITCKTALDSELSSLPPDADSLQKSGYIAGLRCLLGVFGDWDHAPDLPLGLADPFVWNRRYPANRGKLKYRTFITFSANFRATHLNYVRQPNLFSKGFKELFVSRRPPDRSLPAYEDMAGKTVRLADSLCGHGGRHVDDCSICGTEGLPEAVVPRSALFDGADVKFLNAYVAFTGELSRYERPSCKSIRKKNPF